MLEATVHLWIHRSCPLLLTRFCYCIELCIRSSETVPSDNSISLIEVWWIQMYPGDLSPDSIVKSFLWPCLHIASRLCRLRSHLSWKCNRILFINMDKLYSQHGHVITSIEGSSEWWIYLLVSELQRCSLNCEKFSSYFFFQLVSDDSAAIVVESVINRSHNRRTFYQHRSISIAAYMRNDIYYKVWDETGTHFINMY